MIDNNLHGGAFALFDAIQAEADRDRAAVARIGAGMLRAWPHARVWSPETLSLAAQVAANGRDRTTTLPEAAFDWPVYRIAMLACALEDTLYALPGGTLAVHGLGQWTWRSVGTPLSESELRLLDGNR